MTIDHDQDGYWVLDLARNDTLGPFATKDEARDAAIGRARFYYAWEKLRHLPTISTEQANAALAGFKPPRL